MAEQNLTMSADLQVAAREIDFVSRFADNWDHLRELLGIMRPIKKQAGTVLKSKTATVTLATGVVGEGEKTPLSKVEITEKDYTEMELRPYAKEVTAKAIKDHGYEVAIASTDEALLNELQDVVTKEFYAYLNTGELTGTKPTWQSALAMAKGNVLNKFKKIHKTVTKVVGFANVLDFYEWLGDREITTQSAFGFQYIKNFLGYETLFLLSDEEIAQGTVIATPVENLVLYYVDPGMDDFSRAGLNYRVWGETPLIGVHTKANYETNTSGLYALMGMVLFAEYIDGVAVFTVGAGE